MTNRDEVAKRVAERLGVKQLGKSTFLTQLGAYIPYPVWDALISSVERAEKAEARVEALESARVELLLEKKEDCLAVAQLRARVEELQEALKKTLTCGLDSSVREIVRAALSAKEKVHESNKAR